MSSAKMAAIFPGGDDLILYDQVFPLFNEELFQPPTLLQCKEIIEDPNTIVYFLTNIQMG